MKTAELEGAELDYWVAKAEGRFIIEQKADGYRLRDEKHDVVAGINYGQYLHQYSPSTDWFIAGPIIEREGIWLSNEGEEAWLASLPPHIEHGKAGEPADNPCMGEGPTPLIAAMRAYVASKYGEKVDD